MDNANVHEQVFLASVDVLVLDELNQHIDASPVPMAESLWGHMPQDVLELVLPFLPPSSQARFCAVCKRSRQVMTSEEFRDKRSSLAWARGCSRSPRLLGFPGGRRSLSGPEEQQPLLIRTHPQPRVRTVEFPGLLLPEECARAKLSVHGDLLALSLLSRDSQHLQCWVLNLVKQTWRELPPPVIYMPLCDHDDWKVGVKQGMRSSSEFQVFVIAVWAARGTTSDYVFYTYSSVDGDWRTREFPSPTGFFLWTNPADLGEIFISLNAEMSSFTRRGYVLKDLWCFWRWEGDNIYPLWKPFLDRNAYTDGWRCRLVLVSEPDMDTLVKGEATRREGSGGV